VARPRAEGGSSSEIAGRNARRWRHSHDAAACLEVSPSGVNPPAIAMSDRRFDTGLRRRWLLAGLAAAITGVTACGRGAAPGNAGDSANALDVYVAASLDGAVRSALDAYAAAHSAAVRRESGASIALARKITDLHQVPDLLVMADADLFPKLLVPRYARWYLGFATDHMVLAYTRRSRFASSVDSSNWMDVVRRPGVEVGRADPSTAPVGYRTLLLFRLEERHARRPGLADSLLAAAPARNVRGDASALAALLSTGELDFVYDYRSVAEAKGLSYVTLPAEVDLGDPSRASTYGLDSVRVRAGSSADSTTVRGAPILSALTIPLAAPHPEAARAFLAELLGPGGRARFAAAHVDVLQRFFLAGTDTPVVVKSLLAGGAP